MPAGACKVRMAVYLAVYLVLCHLFRCFLTHREMTCLFLWVTTAGLIYISVPGHFPELVCPVQRPLDYSHQLLHQDEYNQSAAVC